MCGRFASLQPERERSQACTTVSIRTCWVQAEQSGLHQKAHQHDHCTPRLPIRRRKAQDLSSLPPALHGLELLCRPCRFMSFLKPGGRLLISDYCRAEGEASQGFAAYIKQRGYDLHSVPAYCSMLEGAGFESVTGEDRTWQVSSAASCRVLACGSC